MRSPCSKRRSACRRGRTRPGRVPRAATRALLAVPRTPRARSSRRLRAHLLPPLRVEVAQAPDALLDLRMRDEERGEALFEKRIERPERLGRRTRLEVDQLRGLLEAEEGIGEPVRRPAQLGGAAVRVELALR